VVCLFCPGSHRHASPDGTQVAPQLQLNRDGLGLFAQQRQLVSAACCEQRGVSPDSFGDGLLSH
jgi:hypothetical protein